MKLRNQLTSLELSKKLEELGVKQDSYFYWRLQEHSETSKGGWEIARGKEDNGYGYTIKLVSAFTVAELGEMLKEKIDKIGKIAILDPRGYLSRSIQRVENMEDEANNRAKVLTYLIENKLIEIS